jgi:2-methylcitrate dehydratase PrpD
VSQGGESATRALAAFAAGLAPDVIPPAIKHEVCRIVLDCLGCGIAGTQAPVGRIVSELVDGEHGKLEATIIGAGRSSLLPAVFANTNIIGALECEPQGPEGHVSAVVVPAALAMAEALDATGAELLAAIIAGIEVAGRVGGATRRPAAGTGPKITPTRGHTYTVLGAAVAAGRLLGLPADEMQHALGIAAYTANVPTLDRFLPTPGRIMTKYDHLGVMTRNGVEAALLAHRGFTGDLTALDGDNGFWRFAGAASCDWESMLGGLGERWTIPEVVFKPFPSAISTLSSIDLTRRMVREHRIQSETIEQVIVRTPRTTGKEVMVPVDHPENTWRNHYFGIAAALLDVRPIRSWLDPAVYQRPDILALMARIQFAPLTPADNVPVGKAAEGWSPARVTIHAGGRTYEGAQDFIRTLPDAELTAKFHENVAGLRPESTAAELARLIWNLERVERARELSRIWVGAK